MGKSEIHQVLEAKPIYCFAFNKDRTAGTLAEHGQTVTSIDWAPETNRIVTCGQDRNAYVWVNTDGEWKPTLVLLRVNRACTYVKWSPKEDKFAVCTGARMVSICNFEEDNDWWVSRHIKEDIRSTTTCVAWHPNNLIVAIGSSDFKVRLFGAAVKGVDKRPADCAWAPGSKLKSFGGLLHEFASPGSGWVHSVAFAPSGDKLAWVSHASSICAVNSAALDTVVSTPIAAKKTGTLDEAKVVKAKENSAMSKFKLMDAKGNTDKTGLDTVHQGAVTHMIPFAGEVGAYSRVATSGKDGKIVVWDL
ncbi:hypothetical protein SARC_10006 [Sphaeroforma arctica JP610]|uniref:Arp2/3 complex 41 kDa subunit n=1 Tax=Sphaeroforma arctica JP610 TaxID=667725 RepID=A0A0L0FL67_9EUKA|nr:hypothetical protein SARC_10006 [Sphaeroforma arctica JP610]KNC77532.1 hypothetical protein SARC_10006 [Sphaeroforma arctica JP610]|eukprot:XP_014151434.1 hypothetical protein SARC_10006 [Sphaeroforma arctica JP610]